MTVAYTTLLAEMNRVVQVIRNKKPLWERRRRPPLPIMPPRQYGMVKVIIKWAADFTGVSSAKMIGRGRSQEISKARWLAMWLIREHRGLSTPAIGRIFNRDHTTVLHGLDRVSDVYPNLEAISVKAMEELGL